MSREDSKSPRLKLGSRPAKVRGEDDDSSEGSSDRGSALSSSSPSVATLPPPLRRLPSSPSVTSSPPVSESPGRWNKAASPRPSSRSNTVDESPGAPSSPRSSSSASSAAAAPALRASLDTSSPRVALPNTTSSVASASAANTRTSAARSNSLGGSSSALPGAYVTARQSYEAQSREELSVSRGDRVQLLRQTSQSRWLGKNDFGDEGLLPATVFDRSNASSGTASPAASNSSGGSPVEPPKKGKSLKEKFGETMAVARSKAATAISSAQAVTKSAATKTKDVGTKAFKKVQNTLVSSPSTRAKDDQAHKDAPLTGVVSPFVYEDALCKPEYLSFTRMLVNCCLLPSLTDSTTSARKRENLTPVPLQVHDGSSFTVTAHATLTEDEMSDVLLTLCGSVGIGSSLEPFLNARPQWSAARRDMFRNKMQSLVQLLFYDVRNLVMRSNEEMKAKAELIHALLHAHLPRGYTLRESARTYKFDKDDSYEVNAIAQLCSLIVRKGGLRSETIFRSGGEDLDSATWWNAVQMNDEGSLERMSVDSLGHCLVMYVQGAAFFQNMEDCIRAGSDWSKGEEIVAGLHFKQGKMLALIIAFFRLFKHGADVHGLSTLDLINIMTGMFFPNRPDFGDGQLSEFVGAIFNSMPLTHPIGDAAVGIHANIVSKGTRKQAFGVVVEYDRARKRYVVDVDDAGTQKISTRDTPDQMQWRFYGTVLTEDVLAYLSAAFFTYAFAPEGALETDGPLHVMLAVSDKAASADAAAQQRETGFETLLFINGGEVGLRLLQTLQASKETRVCITSTAKALAEVFVYREQESSYLQLLSVFVREEVSDTEQLGTLFRGSSAASRILSAFLDTVARPALRGCLSPVVAQLVQADADRLAESRHEGMTEEEEEPLPWNFVAQYAFLFVEAVMAASLPDAVGSCCAMVSEAVQEKFSDDVNAPLIAVGGALFLRCVCPALMAPIEAGLVPSWLTLTPSVSKALSVVAQSIQCLANQVLFSESKPISAMNDLFVEPERERFNEFLQAVCTRKDGIPSQKVSLDKYEEALAAVAISFYRVLQ